MEAVKNKLSGPKRSQIERTRDLALIAKMSLDGLEQESIAQHLNANRPYSLSQQTISKDLATVRKEWMTNALEDFDLLKQIELARVEEDERRVLEVFAEARRPRRTVQITTVKGEPIERITEEQYADGTPAPPLPNPSLLASIDRIRARRCALLGFDSVQKSQDINAAIMRVLQAGYVVRQPTAQD